MKSADTPVAPRLALAGCGDQAAPAPGRHVDAGRPARPHRSRPRADANAGAPGGHHADLDALARRIFPGPNPAACGPMGTCR